jgi:hypothetical protein
MTIPRRGLMSTALVLGAVAGALAIAPFHSFSSLAEPSAKSQPHPFSIRWVPTPGEPGNVTVEVAGLKPAALQHLEKAGLQPAEWQTLLSVFSGQGEAASGSGLPPMAGSYRVQSGVLRFQPQFPLEPGIHYRAVFRPKLLPDVQAAAETITSTFELPRRASGPATFVSQVYPTAEKLPENLLKFYLHFSAPMSGGRIYEHIHLRTSAGKDIVLPFLELDEELWDPTMTRLTLFIDPGRIKRGVRPLEEIGPSIEAGKRYTLVIDRDWMDGTGTPLKESFTKSFQVGPPDRNPINPKNWQIRAPAAGTRDAIKLSFTKPMDHALAQRVIQITDSSSRGLDGVSALENFERTWVFVPAASWQKGSYSIVVQTTLEDLAGNKIGKSF